MVGISNQILESPEPTEADQPFGTRKNHIRQRQALCFSQAYRFCGLTNACHHTKPTVCFFRRMKTAVAQARCSNAVVHIGDTFAGLAKTDALQISTAVHFEVLPHGDVFIPSPNGFNECARP